MLERTDPDKTTQMADEYGGMVQAGPVQSEEDRGGFLFVNQSDPCRILEQVIRKSIIHYEGQTHTGTDPCGWSLGGWTITDYGPEQWPRIFLIPEKWRVQKGNPIWIK